MTQKSKVSFILNVFLKFYILLIKFGFVKCTVKKLEITCVRNVSKSINFS